jgi:hypothetical protein
MRSSQLFSLLDLSLPVLFAMSLQGCVLSDPPIEVPVAGEGGSVTEVGAMEMGAMEVGAMEVGAVEMGAMEMGAMEAGAVMSGGDEGYCTPGEKITTCTICGPDASHIKPKSDPECEPVNCDQLTTYRLENQEDGGQACIRVRATPAEGTCRVLGYCHTTTQTACELNEPEQIYKVYPGCGTQSGCDSTASPTFTQNPIGSTCHTWGSCEAAGCTVSAPCGRLQNAAGGDRNELCEDTDTQCKVSVNTALLGAEVTCRTYCTSGNMNCVGAWQSNGGCQQGASIACDQRTSNPICACE